MTAAPVTDAHPCPRCAEPCAEGARYCSRCGMALVGIVQAPPAAPPPAVTAPPPASPFPAGPLAAAPLPAPAAAAPVTPSAVGRRASPAGWIAVGLGALVFLAASAAVVVVAPDPVEQGPLARWDRMLHNPSTIVDGEPFQLRAEAVNPGEATTGLLWMVIDWRPDDRALDPDVLGQLVACEPADCHLRDDQAGGRTHVYWPGLPPGGRQVYTVTVRLTGLDPGSTTPYRVRVGTGPDEGSLGNARSWSPDPEVEEAP